MPSTTATPGTGRGLLAETDAVAAMPDPVARNRRITQLYHELEVAMADVFASDDLSWCAYGVWASRQVGEAMQGLPPDHVRALLDDPEFVPGLALPPDLDRWARRLAPIAQRVPDSVLAALLDALQPHLAEALGRGNHRVFTELAPTFAGFLDLAGETDGDPDAIGARLPDLYERLGHVTYPGGAGYELTVLCDCYLRAIRSSDPHERTQLIFYGNLRGRALRAAAGPGPTGGGHRRHPRAPRLGGRPGRGRRFDARPPRTGRAAHHPSAAPHGGCRHRQHGHRHRGPGEHAGGRSERG